jgi:hypothetical protein
VVASVGSKSHANRVNRSEAHPPATLAFSINGLLYANLPLSYAQYLHDDAVRGKQPLD